MREFLRTFSLKLESFLQEPLSAWFAVVILPVPLLMLDPVLCADDGLLGGGLLGGYKAFCLIAIGMVMVATSFLLLFDRCLAFVVGIMAGGALLSSALGLLMLPFSILGLAMLGLGLLGLAPFLTSVTLIAQIAKAFERQLGREASLHAGPSRHPRRLSQARMGASLSLTR